MIQLKETFRMFQSQYLPIKIHVEKTKGQDTFLWLKKEVDGRFKAIKKKILNLKLEQQKLSSTSQENSINFRSEI